jgi:hypothetical protein
MAFIGSPFSFTETIRTQLGLYITFRIGSCPAFASGSLEISEDARDASEMSIDVSPRRQSRSRAVCNDWDVVHAHSALVALGRYVDASMDPTFRARFLVYPVSHDL